MEYKRIILALPNSASESLMQSINSHSKLTCKQLFTIEPLKLEMMSKQHTNLMFLVNKVFSFIY